MSVLDRPALVPVPLGFCPCEGEPHPDGDIVYLRPELSASAGIRAQSHIIAAATGTLSQAEAEEILAALWLDVGVAEWTFLFDDGTAVPVTHDNIVRALPYGKGGAQVADVADGLYAPSVMTPLLAKLSTPAKRGPTSSTSSPRRRTSRARTSRSK